MTLLRAPNPGPMTLDGTNTWVLRAPDQPAAVVIDPGPADEGHLAAVAGTAPVGLILITHGHPDHVDGVPRPGRRDRRGRAGRLVAGPPARATTRSPAATSSLVDSFEITVLATPGHTADSVCFLVERRR